MTMTGMPRGVGGVAPVLTDQMDFVETFAPWFGGLNGTTDTANRATFIRVRVAKPIIVSQLTIFVITASGNVDLGIYQSDGTTLTRLASTGSTAIAGANASQTINLSAPVTLMPGVDYYFAKTTDNGTASIARYAALNNALGVYKNRIIQVGTAFPLPATVLHSATSGTSLAWWIAAA